MKKASQLKAIAMIRPEKGVDRELKNGKKKQVKREGGLCNKLI